MWSAVFKTKGSYAFFDFHCHEHNGLSATDGASSLLTFSSLDDLITYMYAFYYSMKLDTNLQFDFLPINVKHVYNKKAIKTKFKVIWKLTLMNKDCDRLTKWSKEDIQ